MLLASRGTCPHGPVTDAVSLPHRVPLALGWHGDRVWRAAGTGLARGWAPGSRLLRRSIRCRRQQQGAAPEPSTAGHGDLERLLPWDVEVITHT